jgi:hypothetical protein
MIRIPPNGTRQPHVPLPQMSLRSRHEPSTRDFVNAQNYEHWQTDGRYGIQNRADKAAQAPFYDMMPASSRTDDRSYQQSQNFVAGGSALTNNPYFQQYDVTQDPRNVARELRGAVFEAVTDRGLQESKRIMERQFTSQYVPEAETRSMTETILVGRDRLMPQMDDYRRMYPKVLNSGQVCDDAATPYSNQYSR